MKKKQVAGAASGIPDDAWSGVVVFHRAKAQPEVAQSVPVNQPPPCLCEPR